MFLPVACFKVKYNPSSTGSKLLSGSRRNLHKGRSALYKTDHQLLKPGTVDSGFCRMSIGRLLQDCQLDGRELETGVLGADFLADELSYRLVQTLFDSTVCKVAAADPPAGQTDKVEPNSGLGVTGVALKAFRP